MRKINAGWFRGPMASSRVRGDSRPQQRRRHQPSRDEALMRTAQPARWRPQERLNPTRGETHMRSRLTKKRMLTLASVLVVALAGIAYAFYSSTGTGTGSGSAAGGDGSGITVDGTLANAVA